MEKIRRTPFLLLLIPLLAGIIVQYYFYIHKWSIIPLVSGLGIMLLSYFIPSKKQFELRWLYGLGLYMFLFAIGIMSTLIRQQISAFNFQDINKSYSAAITDIPQEKPNTFAYRVELEEPNKKIVCYLPKDSATNSLKVGDNILFFSKIEPFKSSGNPDEFNYARYMYNKGYAGYTFIRSDRWEKSDKKANSLFIKATECRQTILHLYKSLGLDDNEYAILCALTLGYKDSLTDDLAESFRATGTAHILAVSGMHVGIIYMVILSILSFIPRNSKYSWIKQMLVILFLWSYAFIIGFPPSAVRACIMLTLFCISQLMGMRGYSLNTLLATAFLMLVWNPFYLFDVGFQLSFAAVLSMILLVPVFSKWGDTKNKYFNYFKTIFIVSLAAQIGTLPLCLYYFGSFPVYFFLTNLLIIPLITLIIYDAVLITVLSGMGSLFPQIFSFILHLPVALYKFLISITINIIQFFEHLPFAQLNNIKISTSELFIFTSILVSFIYFLIKKNPKMLICSFTGILLLLAINIHSKINNKDSLFIYNNRQHPEITYHIKYNRFYLTDITENKIISLNQKKYMIVSDDIWKEKISDKKLNIDYLHLIGDNSVSLYSLTQKFNIEKIILDGSLSNRTLKRFVSECEKLRIPYYDVSENGVLRIFF